MQLKVISVAIAFQSGSHRRQLILVAGLTDGLLSMSYTQSLATALDSRQWSLVLAQISSCYQGYGLGSLDRDAEELHSLAVHLKERRSCEEFAMMGHSTGCQDTVRFLKLYGKAKEIPQLKGVVLQGAVSDQEWRETLPGTESRIELAQEMQDQGRGNEFLPRDFEAEDGDPMTASRLLSLAKRRGDDDMFSSYLTDVELQELFHHMADVRCLILNSGSDEYVPEHVDKERLAARFAKAMGPQTTNRIIEGATHGAENRTEEVIEAVMQFLNGT